ncbi:uncharacterized protein LOC119675984 [Teleopsis dalmanni]|uniref:uncharacterized protein LOC119675984 n=1 Tax=Teleopsis dalmanni TaxID=139649 RepID=UPI0018CD79CA|nr:uncharacterized protein LOC119675984 [Teleopsis dalmanni]
MEAASRASCRTQGTKIYNTVDAYFKQEILQEPDVASKESTLNIYLSRINNAHQRLLKADEIVQSKVTQEDWAQEFETALEYDDRAVGITAKIQCELKRINSNSYEEVLRNENPSRTIVNSETNTKLKPLELKKFDGNLENWMSFWEQFKQAIHENSKLDAASKFNYLSDALVGKAAAAMTGFLPTERCYDDAIELLLEEYGDSDKIVDKYIL